MRPKFFFFKEKSCSKSEASKRLLSWWQFSSFFFFNIFTHLFLAALGPHCCRWAFSNCGEWGLLFPEVRGLLIVMASLVKHGL